MQEFVARVAHQSDLLGLRFLEPGEQVVESPGKSGDLVVADVLDEVAHARIIGSLARSRGGTLSPPRFADLDSVEAFRKFGDRVREVSGGIPIGFKLSAQHIEDDIDFALEAGADYIILDGRGGGTGAAPREAPRRTWAAAVRDGRHCQP